MLFQLYNKNREPLEKYVILPDNSEKVATELAIASELEAIKFLTNDENWMIADDSQPGEFYRIVMPSGYGLHRFTETYLYLQRATLSRRVTIYPDTDYTIDFLDRETEFDRWQAVEKMINDNGVWGYVCEALICGEWEHIDSCWGFIAGDSYRELLATMREHMPPEFRTIEPMEGKV